MTCKYQYNGLTFNSELELDLYLLFNKKLMSSLGDAVFKQDPKSRWSDLQRQIDSLLNENNKILENGESSGDIKESKKKEGEPSDLDPLTASGDYKSITDIIHSLNQVNDEGEIVPVFPEFRPKSYWDGTPANPGGLKELYRLGLYDRDEIRPQLSFVEDLITDGSGNRREKITDKATLDKIEERMTSVWEQLAKCGDLVHDLMSEFFREKRESDKKPFRKMTEDELKEALIEKTLKEYYNKYRSYITKEIVESAASSAIKIYNKIKLKYGDDCIIYSEKKVLGLGLDKNSTFPIVGRIDLLVVSRDGRIGIMDFKCSPKDYTESNYNKDITKYDSAKILTFKYQLAAYRKLLESLGIKSNGEMELAVIPLKFEDFGFDKNTKKVKFLSISIIESDPVQTLSNTSITTGGNLYNIIENNLSQIFPRPQNNFIMEGDILLKVSKHTKDAFKIKKDSKHMNKEDISEYIKEHGGIKKNNITLLWEFKDDYDIIYRESGNKTKEEAEISIFEKLASKLEYKENYVVNTTSGIRKSFLELNFEFKNLASRLSFNLDEPIWIQETLGKYCDSTRWEIISDEHYNPIFDELGILMFKNKYTGLIDIIRISDYFDPRLRIKFAGKNRTTILGTYLSDDVIKSNSENQVLDGRVGNMELMETMFFLNEIPSFFLGEKTGIGSITLMRPDMQRGLSVNNELLLYNFQRLTTLGKVKNNFSTRGENDKIKMVDRVSACRETFYEIISSQDTGGTLGKLSYEIRNKIKSCLSEFDLENPNILRKKLIDLDRDLTGANPESVYGYKNLNLETTKIPDETLNPEYFLHRQILFAITLLSGVNLVLQLEDHTLCGFDKGLVGTAFDNPGTLLSKILNTFTDLVTIAYLNTRDNVIAFNLELRKRVEALKAAKNFGLSKLYLVGNLVLDLYLNMYDNSSGDLLFKNPWDMNSELTPEEREFLKFAILKINDNRIKNFDPSTIETEIQRNPELYLRVPLTKGDLSSKVAVRDGWLGFIKSRFAMLHPKRISATLKTKYDVNATLFISEDKYQEKIKKGQFWEALNSFDQFEKEKERKRVLSDERLGGEAFFEHNLETLLLKHTSAYKMAEELNNIFPVLRALTLHLNLQGHVLNKTFYNDIEYILKYIKTRIHNRPVEDRNKGMESLVADITKTMMLVTSKLALAFNPRQWYLFLDGIWKDILMVVKNYPNEETPFTKEGVFKGWKLAISDLRHFGNDFTMSELLNQQYGFNDMDANTYIDRIKTDNTGLLYHFWNIGFRFASRPDFYNRMTLFYAQMIKEGTLEAHSIVDGKLVYDWTKDKRFDLFAKYKGNDSIVPASELKKYNQLKSLYITMGRQFEQEGTLDSDGNPFQLDLLNPKSFPKAYTNKLSESMKAISDRIYGYYAHEKKSMIHSTTIGALFMQMNTYWSAKKNQYAQKRSYTQEGDWVEYEEDGFKYCWEEDENGNLLPKRIENPEDDTGVPVKVWKGKPLEGIALTMFEFVKALNGNSDLTDKSGISGIYDILTNENIDKDVRRLYGANFRQLIADLLLWLLIGNIMLGSLDKLSKDYVKSIGNDSVGKALGNTGFLLSTSILRASARDADFIESIFGRGTQWTPFAILSSDRLLKQAYRLGTGKQSLFDFITKSGGFGRSTEPVWDFVKLETLGKKIGEK